MESDMLMNISNNEAFDPNTIATDVIEKLW
jgi:hypothetical protein